MNYKLRTYADRVQGKRCFILEGDGRVLSEKVSKFSGDNIKENALTCVYQGLIACKGVVTHDDILVIEVQNSHLCEWLNGLSEHKNYSEALEKVFDMLDKVDCRYRFCHDVEPTTKRYLKKSEITKVEVSSVDDMMKDFE